jgi:hypothetical protein
LRILLALAAGASALAMATTAGAVTYTFNVPDAAFSLPLGTVEVTGQGSSTLTFDIKLASGVYFQALGGGNANPAFFFSLTGLNGAAVSYNFLTPAGGNAPGSMNFTGLQAGSYGHGGISPFAYGVQDQDTDTPPTNYYGGELKFTVTNTGGSLDLAPVTADGTKIYGGADLRQLVGDRTVTGGAGFTQTGGVPEPATWAMMIMGIFGAGAVLRRQRQAKAALV